MKFRIFEYDKLGGHKEIDCPFPSSSVVPLVDFPGYSVTTIMVDPKDTDTVVVWVKENTK